MRIVIEPEVPGDSRSLFRLLVGEKVVAEGMTAAQIHILVGDILEKVDQSEAATAEPPRPSKIDDEP